MTEATWFACHDLNAMLFFLRTRGKLSERKARLFAASCCRRMPVLHTDETLRKAIEAAEEFADGLCTKEELWVAGMAAYEVFDTEVDRFDCLAVSELTEWPTRLNPSDVADAVVNAVDAKEEERVVQADLLREAFGPLPFRPIRIDPAWLAWNDGTVVKLAEAAYTDRDLPSGHLSQVKLAVLCDALEEAGANAPELLGHLRSDGPHYRGCWAIDLLLNKS
jgi:hypothetical protein